MFSTMFGIAISISAAWTDAPSTWHGDYATAHAEACKADKPLFIVICPASSDYARMMALGTFMSDEVERVLRADYVRFMLDTTTPEGKAMAKQFDATEGPHFVILDRSGKWQVYYQAGVLLEHELTPILARFRRSKLNASGRSVEPVVVTRRLPVQLCST
jgi:hypothetical protein